MPSESPGRDLGQEFRDLEDLVQQLRQSLDELREIQDLARTIRSSVSPDEILHVGDHPLRDVAGARKAGFRTCLRLTEGIYAEEVLLQAEAEMRILKLADLLTLPELAHG